MNWQVFDAVGIALGFTANLILSTQGKSLRPPDSVKTCGSAADLEQEKWHGVGRSRRLVCHQWHCSRLSYARVWILQGSS
jgi:hypothetical protein